MTELTKWLSDVFTYESPSSPKSTTFTHPGLLLCVLRFFFFFSSE